MATYSSKRISALAVALTVALVAAGGCKGGGAPVDAGLSDAGARLGASYPFAYPVGTATGDLGGSYPAPTVTGLQGHAVPGPTGTNTNLQWSGSAYSWSAASSGFTAAGDLSGTSSSQTVVGLQGRSLLSTAPSTGNAVLWGGSSWAPGAVNLAGGAGSITGTLPTGNQAAQAMGGDVTGTTGAAVVAKVQGNAVSATTPTAGQLLVENSGATGSAWTSCSGDVSCSTSTPGAYTVGAIGGTSPIPVTPNNLQWVQGAAPSLSQVQQANGSNPSSFTLTPQAPGAGAASTATGTPGSLVVALAAPVSTGAEAQFVLSRASSTRLAAIGAFTGTSAATWGFWLGPTNIAVDTTTVAEFFAGTGVVDFGKVAAINYLAPAAGIREFGVNGSTHNAEFFGGVSGTFSIGGGSGVIGIHDATTAPTTNPASGAILYSSAGAARWRGSGGATTQFAAVGTGTVNSQAGLVLTDTGALRTVSDATPTTVYSYATATATSGHFSADTTCRAITAPTAGAIGDTWASKRTASYRNIGGTITIVGTLTALDTDTDTSMSGTAVTATSSGASLLIQVANVASATVDCLTEFHVVVN